MPAKRTTRNPAVEALRKFALGYPEATEDFPWGERVIKVRKKVFVFMGHGDREVTLSVKLPQSALFALDLPFVEPTGYGLGKSGWVTVKLGARDKVPVEMLRRWIDESYRAVAPKTLVARLEATEAPARAGARRSGRRAGAGSAGRSGNG